jgi:hypothetical protein
VFLIAVFGVISVLGGTAGAGYSAVNTHSRSALAPASLAASTPPTADHPRTPAYPPAERAALLAAARALAGCMHGQGVSDFPVLPPSFGDGQTSAPPVGGPSGRDVNPASGVFQQASAACAPQSAEVRTATLAANGLNPSGADATDGAWPPMAPPDFGPGVPTYPVGRRPAVLAAASALQSCMRQHGVADFPTVSASYGDGQTAGPRLGGQAGSDLDTSTTRYGNARNACVHQIDEVHRVMLEAAGDLP